MRISYSKKETKNLGNYENIVVEISIEDEVDTLIETKEDCFFRLKEFVTTKLLDEFKNNNEEKHKIKNNKEETVDIEEVKINILKLISLNERNRVIIKDILKSYNVDKAPNLSTSQLVEFNNKLLELLK